MILICQCNKMKSRQMNPSKIRDGLLLRLFQMLKQAQTSPLTVGPSRVMMTTKVPRNQTLLSTLTSLFLRDNADLTGTIPTRLASLTRLTQLSLQSNDLSGTIPSELSRLSVLESLDLGGNRLNGTIPQELASLTNLEILILQNCELTGTIPAQLSTLTSLINMNLSQNRLTGTVPSELSTLGALKMLHLDHNLLSGSVPVGVCAIDFVAFSTDCPRKVNCPCCTECQGV
mmetsp:Transcript_10302/g.23821  ORF Transcript_10302/g.23821 Transcript_10302/m.23821 type:complete len:230 (-) Transcript_10302:427-1116(-)